jgi:hypothetical protein
MLAQADRQDAARRTMYKAVREMGEEGIARFLRFVPGVVY